MPIPLAAEIVIGGVVGTIIADLYRRILILNDLIFHECVEFKLLLKDLEKTVKGLEPLVRQIEGFNTIVLKLPSYAGMDDLEKEMRRGLELVVEYCNKASVSSVWLQVIHATELKELVESLKGQHKIVQRVRDEKENLFLSRTSMDQLDEVMKRAKEIMTLLLEHHDQLRKKWEESNSKSAILTKKFDSFLEDWTSFTRNTHSSVPIGEEIPFQDVPLIGAVQGEQLSIEESLSLPVGLDVPLNELKMKLLHTDEQVPMLVLTGIGGCGKTTLAKHFCADEEVKGRFEGKNIFFVTVLQGTSLECNLLHAGSSRYIPNDELLELLKQTGNARLLLVLDDVWTESIMLLDDLHRLMKPKWKILVTSRLQFQRSYTSAFYINPLNNEDAITLFLHSASKGDRRGSYVSKDLLTQIVELFKGLPLAVEVIGTSFGRKSAKYWNERLREWSTGALIIDFESHELRSCLQRSIDELNKTEDSWIKECFIQLSSFPKGQRIPVVALIDMWAELDNVFNQTKAIYDQDEGKQWIVKLKVLSNKSLARIVLARSGTLDIMDGYYSEHFVVQHEMLRELAIYQSHQRPLKQRNCLIIDIFENKFPEWWTRQKHDQPIRARLLSISTDEVFSMKWPKIEFPQTEVLVLNFQSNSYVLPAFVKEMEMLKVLIITNYGFSQVDGLTNFELLGSLAKLKRIRLERISFHFIIKCSKELKSLQKISLFLCRVGPAFSDNSFPCPFPNLVELNIDYCSDLVEVPRVVELIHLKKLSITNCHKLSALPNQIGEKLVILQVLRLRSCTALEELPDSVCNLTQLIVLDVSNCCSLRKFPENIGRLSSLQELNMRQCSRLQEQPLSVKNLTRLQELICDEDMTILWDMYQNHLDDAIIKVVNEEINLNSLGAPLSANDVVARNIRLLNQNKAAETEKLLGHLEQLPDLVAIRLEELMDNAAKSYFDNTVKILRQELSGIDAVKREMSAISSKLDGITNFLIGNTWEPSGSSDGMDSKAAKSKSSSDNSLNAINSRNRGKDKNSV